MPDYVVDRAENGTWLVVCKVNSPLASVRCVVESGSRNEIAESGEYGVAHFLEHMFFKGTEKKGYQEINRILERLGNPNAYTSNPRTVYFIDTLPRIDNLRSSLDILTEMVYESLIPEEELEKEKGTIVQEWQASEDSPLQHFFMRAGEAYAGPFAHATIGQKSTIEGMTRDHLVSFKKRTYTADNMAFCIVGNVDEDEAMKLLHEFVDKRENLSDEKHSPYHRGDLQKETRVNFTHSAEQAIVSIWYPWYTPCDERELNQLPDVTVNAIGGGMHSLIFDRIREKLGLVYSTGAFSTLEADVPCLVCYGLCERQRAAIVEEEIQKIIDEVLLDGVDDEIFDVSLENCQFRAVSALQTIGGISHFTVDRFHRTRHYMGNTFDDSATLIERFKKVTSKDIPEAMNIIRGVRPFVITQNVE